MKRIRERTVGKQGYLGEVGTSLANYTKEWQRKAQELEKAGFKIEYSIEGSMPDPSGQYRPMVRVTYPDGSVKVMSRTEAYNIEPE